ncbi:MAG: hypothetical protein LBM39_01365 [Candidatus Methanoplasma sp.]|nr:hypothetical protein [Candidatus Methanoplasma sp.]
MSGDSSRFSGSIPKGIFKRVLRPEPNTNNVTQVEVKQRHPGFSVSNGTDYDLPGRTARHVEPVSSPGLKQLSGEGYVVYNVKEKEDVYISIQPDSAYFEENEPGFIKMEPGSFVSGQKAPQTSVVSIPEPIRVQQRIEYEQPADIFVNAQRKQTDSVGEIDFNEVIIKKSEEYDADLDGPVTELFNPGRGSENLYSSEPESVPFDMITAQEAAMTSVGSIVAPQSKEAAIPYEEDSDYGVEVVADVPTIPGRMAPYNAEVSSEKPVYRNYDQASEVPAKVVPTIPAKMAPYRSVRKPKFDPSKIIRAPRPADKVEPLVPDTTDTDNDAFNVPLGSEEKILVDEFPAGMQDVMRQLPTNEANTDDDVADRASFIGNETVKSEAAFTTSVVAPIQNEVQLDIGEEIHVVLSEGPKESEEPAVPQATVLKQAPTQVEEVIPEEIVAISSETVADFRTYEVKDLVADLIMITLPEMVLADDPFSELTGDETVIPDDGLESYDDKFVFT